MEYYLNTIKPMPKHGEKGCYREFIGEWSENLVYSGDRLGCDIYCAYCNHWSTIKNTNILFSVIGKCKNCGKNLNKNMKRVLRVSGLKDYLAIDIVKEENGREIIKENYFYFEKLKPVIILYKDQEESKWFKQEVTFDGETIKMVDIDPRSDWMGTEYEIDDLEELLDERLTKKF